MTLSDYWQSLIILEMNGIPVINGRLSALFGCFGDCVVALFVFANASTIAVSSLGMWCMVCRNPKQIRLKFISESGSIHDRLLVPLIS